MAVFSSYFAPIWRGVRTKIEASMRDELRKIKIGCCLPLSSILRPNYSRVVFHWNTPARVKYQSNYYSFSSETVRICPGRKDLGVR